VFVLEVLESLSVGRAALVMAPTPYVCEALKARHDVEVHAVLNAVDDSVFPRRSPTRERNLSTPLSLCYHGTLAQRFGVHTVIRAIAECRAAGVVVTLDVYGDGDSRGGLERLAKELGLTDVVSFHGQVQSALLAPMLSEHDVGVIPYEDSTFMRLAYSTKAFEYAALGVPMIAADLPPIHDQLGDGGALFYSPGSASDLAAGISEIASDWSQAHDAALHAQSRLADFTWDKWSRVYVDLIEGLA
jgi:glycosyltransferase involved in cell wall biosynthesis